MALKSSFKQQCPSCEAMVPIRDPGLIGRKIDCPKCKYRFVVEEPEEAVEEAEESPAKKGKPTAITAKKPANGKAPAKGAPAKAAPKRRPDDDDDDEDDEEDSRPKKKKSSGSGMLILGLCLGGVAIIALVFGVLAMAGVIVLTGGEKKKPGSSGGPTASITPPGGAETKQETPKEQKKEAVRPKLADATNLLPNDSQVVLNLPMEHLMGNAGFKKAVVMTPGSFNEQTFQRTWGVAPTDISRVVLGLNVNKKTVFSVMQSLKPLKSEQIVARLRLKAEAPIDNLKYYLLGRPLDALSIFLLEANEVHEKVALHFPNDYTVVCADLAPMQQFLQDKGHPKHLSEPPAAEQPPAAGTRPGGPPMPGMTGPGGGASGPMGMSMPPPGGGGKTPSSPTPGGSGPSPPPPGSSPPPGGGGYQLPQGGGPGMMSGNYPGGSGAAETSTAAPVSSSYLTVEKDLKAVLDQVEKIDNKEQQNVLLSVALPYSRFDDFRYYLSTFLGDTEATALAALVKSTVLSDGKAVGVALTEMSASKLSAAAAVAAKDDKIAKEFEQTFSTQMPTLLTLAHLDLIAKNASRSNTSGTPNSSGMPNMPMPGGSGAGSGTPSSGPSREDMMRMYQQNQRQQQQGSGAPVSPGGGFQPGMPPGMQPQGGDEKKEPKGKDGDYLFWTKDNVVALGVNYNIKTERYDELAAKLDATCIRFKSIASVADNRSHLHELAEATQAFVKREGHFPRGTVPRRLTTDRPIDWRPDQRMSWMVPLLSYVGNGEYRDLKPESDKGWNESEANLSIASMVVPQYLAPLPPDRRLGFFIQYPTAKGGPVAATHFVGVAGVGLDAAEYRAEDAATAKLRGIFGYDRETKLDDIKDGPGETILLLQVPPEPHSPWIAGGGSTVRGVSQDIDCVQPFVCTKYQDKDGTFAIMADGKVRFIPASIDPKTFQAMCTIAGGERIKDINGAAPEVPPPDDEPAPQELKAEEAAPPTAPPVVQVPKAADGSDLPKLQGTWNLVAVEGRGQSMPAEQVREIVSQLIIRSEEYALVGSKSKEGGSFKLNESKTPKEFDARVSVGSLAGQTELGIYSLSGDDLKLFLAKPGQPRPVGFTTKAEDSGKIVFIFKRAKP